MNFLRKYGFWVLGGLFVLLITAMVVWIFVATHTPDTTEEVSPPPIGEVVQEPKEAPENQVEPTEVGPTPTPWPSIQMPKEVVVNVPSGYTIPGDIQICTTAEKSSCKKTYDDDGETTTVWVFEQAAYAMYPYGNGWAEHVYDPLVFVDAQFSEGCTDGCDKVVLLTWPTNAKEFGFDTSQISEAPESIATESAEAPAESVELTPVAPEPIIVAEGDWASLPSWSNVTKVEGLAPAAAPVDIESQMAPEALPNFPASELEYQLPEPGDCYARNDPNESCTTGRLRPFSAVKVEVKPGMLLRMTGDAISIKWSGSGKLLAIRPDGSEKHDLWIVLNVSSTTQLIDINAPYGSDRSWYTSTSSWTPDLVDHLTRQALQDFNLQERDESEFQFTPVPNCEASSGCTYSNVRVVIVTDDVVYAFTGKWFEKSTPHWQPFPPTFR